MNEFSQGEKDCIVALNAVEDALEYLLDEMKSLDFNITSEQSLRVCFVRARRALGEIEASKHFRARIMAGKTVTNRPKRPIEDDMLPKPETENKEIDT